MHMDDKAGFDKKEEPETGRRRERRAKGPQEGTQSKGEKAAFVPISLEHKDRASA